MSVLRPGWWGAPLSAPYAAAVLARRWAFDRGLLVSFVPACFTVAVGGLEAGGSGKTPIAGLLLAAFVAAGRRPGLLTRGYGRQSAGLVVRERGEAAQPSVLGDEPSMLVHSGLDVPVAACASRTVGAQALALRGCDVLVLDDGFAHRRLSRNVNVVVLRGERPLGNGHLLPWGTLREPPSSLRRAHVVWLHYRAGVVGPRPEWLARYAPEAKLVSSVQQPAAARDGQGREVALDGTRVVAAAGIADPAGFGRTLLGMGALVTELVPLRDHHVFTPADVARLAALVAARGAAALVVTAKDAVKLAPMWQGPPLWVVDARVLLTEGAAALASVLRLPAGAFGGEPTVP